MEDALSALCIAATEEAQLTTHSSALSVSLALALSESGAFVVEGGTARVCRSLCAVVRECGGVVLKDVRLRNVDFSLSGTEYAATGVSLDVSPGDDAEAESATLSIAAKRSVVSGLGVLCSTLSLLPREAISAQTKEQLSSVRERRPHVKVVLWVRGSVEELQLQSTQHFEIAASRFSPSSDAAISFSALDEEMSRFEELLHASYVKVWSPSAQGQTR